MKPLFKRILLFFTAIPLILAIIFFLPFFNHLALNLIVLTVSVISVYELSALFEKKNIPRHKKLLPLYGFVLPLISYLIVADILPKDSLFFGLLLLILLVFFKDVFIRTEEEYENIINRISSNLFLIIYPGVFLSYFVLFSGFRNASFYIGFFYSMVFMNDVAAYIFGKLFGNRSRKLLLVSPNKSLIGFIAGFLTSIAVAVTGRELFPEHLPTSLLTVVILGGGIGITTIFGDLVESAVKRSTGTKDSGTLVPGRGGVLDSLDSVLFSAPIFYYIIRAIL